jgi:hypothetical protein
MSIVGLFLTNISFENMISSKLKSKEIGSLFCHFIIKYNLKHDLEKTKIIFELHKIFSRMVIE